MFKRDLRTALLSRSAYSTLRSATLYAALLFFPVILAALSACAGQPKANSGGARPSSTPATTGASGQPTLRPRIVAFGDSLTAGYGLSPADSYPALLQKKLDADGFNYEVINAGVSGDTTAAGVRRIDWSLDSGNVRFVILELGANDFLRGQSVAEAKKNLKEIIEKSTERGATVLLAGMYTTSNTGKEYQQSIHEMYRALAREHDLTLIPFFLEGVAGDRSLNLEDGVHPNAKGTEVVTENVYKYLKPMLEGAGKKS